MKPLALTPPAELSPWARAAELTTLLASAIVRTLLAEGRPEHAVGLGFLPGQRVHTTPYRQERL